MGTEINILLDLVRDYPFDSFCVTNTKLTAKNCVRNKKFTLRRSCYKYHMVVNE